MKAKNSSYLGDWFREQMVSASEIPVAKVVVLVATCAVIIAFLGQALMKNWGTGTAGGSYIFYGLAAYSSVILLTAALILLGTVVGTIYRLVGKGTKS
jgi:hypothetical protein